MVPLRLSECVASSKKKVSSGLALDDKKINVTLRSRKDLFQNGRTLGSYPDRVELFLKTIAVIFAGGVGTRMGNPNLPKQLMEVEGKPILRYTLELFQEHPTIDGIYLIVAKERVDTIWKLVNDGKLSKVQAVVEGGNSAHESIHNGLKAARADGVDDDAVVLIHDGVRPIISSGLISRNIAQVLELGSAITSIPAYETVAISRDGHQVEAVPNRAEMFALQAPQSFRLGKILAVNDKAADENKIGSFIDQAHLMSFYGEAIHLLQGIRSNIKITVPGDLDHFEFLVNSGKYKEIIDG